MRVIGIADDRRLSSLADVPTLKEQDVDFNYSLWMAPAATPRPVVLKLAEALRFAAEDVQVRAQFAEGGAQPWVTTPEEFRDYLAKELTDTASLVQALQIPKE